jgi:hypothetical protein
MAIIPGSRVKIKSGTAGSFEVTLIAMLEGDRKVRVLYDNG